MANALYTRSYSSFCGVDIRATFGSRYIGELQGVSYTVTREKAPLYTMGSPDPRSFSRGKRGIAGSLIFLTFDREAMLEGLRDLRYVANADDIASRWNDDALPIRNLSAADRLTVSGSGTQIVNTSEDPAYLQYSFEKVLSRPMYYDQIPPFNIVLSAANEYGHTMIMEIRGVEVMNAGSGTSIDDITIDTTCTFVATQVIPWSKQGHVDADGVWHPMEGNRFPYSKPGAR